MPAPTSRRRARLTLVVAATALLAVIAIVPGSAPAYQRLGFRWEGSPVVVKYHSYIGNPQVKRGIGLAVRAWNRSGIRLHFRRVPAAKAQLKIRFRHRAASPGCSTFGGMTAVRWTLAGSTKHNRPHLPVRIYLSRKKQMPGYCRYIVAQVAAHELGHSIGLAHENHACATMSSLVDSNCPAAPAGKWRCRLLQRDDLRGARSLYGGKIHVRKHPFCKM